MVRRVISIFLLLILLLSLSPMAFAHPTQREHDQDLSDVLFGRGYNLVGEKKKAFQAIADAAALCIDQFSVNAVIKSKKQLFESLDQRIGFSFAFEDIELQQLPGGINASATNHRRYTHRGWSYSAVSTQMQKLWDKRKLILTATVNKELFGKTPGILRHVKWVEGLVYSEKACNAQCEAFCELVYYVHILGDYLEAKSNSDEFKQMLSLVRREGTTDPAVIDDLIALIPKLFDSRSGDTSGLIQELERIKEDAKSIYFVQGGIRTQEQFDNYHHCAEEIMDTLEDYIPGLLRNTDFFSSIFY